MSPGVCKIADLETTSPKVDRGPEYFSKNPSKISIREYRRKFEPPSLSQIGPIGKELSLDSSVQMLGSIDSKVRFDSQCEIAQSARPRKLPAIKLNNQKMLEDVLLSEREIVDHNSRIRQSMPSPGIWAVAQKNRRTPTVGKGGFNLLPAGKLSQSIDLSRALHSESSVGLLSEGVTPRLGAAKF